MVNADRQTIMEVNRSLRNIKNELENLLEKGVIDESVYDQLHSTLPDESPLSGPLRTAGNATAAAPAPARSQNPTPAPANPSPAPQSETVLFDSRNPNARNEKATPFQSATPSRSPAPPAYSATQPPPPPARNQPPAQPPQQQYIAHCIAIYDYNVNPHQPTGPQDLKMHKGQKIGIVEYKNADWWMGRNIETNQLGIFPQNHVRLDEEKKPMPPQGPPQQRAPVGYPQQPQYGYPQQQPQYGYPQQQQQYNGPPPQQNPYNANVPPMAVAQGGDQQQQGEGSGGGKAGEMGKKFGKKLGNAAIFGAGATIGGNIVNSIF